AIAWSPTASAAEPAAEQPTVTVASQSPPPAAEPPPQPTPAVTATPATAAPPLATTTNPGDQTVLTAAAVEPAATPAMPPAAAPSDTARLNVRRSRARNLMISGWSIAGITYATSLVAGAIAFDIGALEWGTAMMVPGIGPFIAAGFAARDGTATGTVFTAALGAAQVVGFTLGGIGTYRLRKLDAQMHLAATPMRGGGQLALTMRF
ncbi:MAG: hypothetical protein K0V04_22095, partial [Deltaproteobacteria bacterium]|nr:hypothetical protein [Deltaproteobacteria bacterium]